MARLDQLQEGQPIEKTILARKVAVVKVGDDIHAIESECKHMRASLATGKVENGKLKCRWHGWEYELATGKCLTVDKFKLKRYEVEIENDEVYVIL